MSEVRCADGETLRQAREQPGQCVLELQQIHRDGLHRQPKHPGAVIVVSNANKNVANVKSIKNVKSVKIVKNVKDDRNDRNVKNDFRPQGLVIPV